MAGGPSAELLEFVGHPVPMDTWEPDDDFRSEEPPEDYDPSYEPDHEYLAEMHLAGTERRGEELAEEADLLAERMTAAATTRSRWLAVASRLVIREIAHVDLLRLVSAAVGSLRHVVARLRGLAAGRPGHLAPRSTVGTLVCALTIAPNAPSVRASAA